MNLTHFLLAGLAMAIGVGGFATLSDGDDNAGILWLTAFGLIAIVIVWSGS